MKRTPCIQRETAVEDAGGQQIQEKSLEGEENREREAAGGGHGKERGRDEHQSVRVFLPGA